MYLSHYSNGTFTCWFFKILLITWENFNIYCIVRIVAFKYESTLLFTCAVGVKVRLFAISQLPFRGQWWAVSTHPTKMLYTGHGIPGFCLHSKKSDSQDRFLCHDGVQLGREFAYTGIPNGEILHLLLLSFVCCSLQVLHGANSVTKVSCCSDFCMWYMLHLYLPMVLEYLKMWPHPQQRLWA